MFRTLRPALLFSAFVLTFFCATSITVAQDVTTGLVSQYSFESNTDDGSGNGFDGTPFGELGYGEGQCGQAVELDGIDDYVQIPGQPLGDWTVSAWFRETRDTGTWQRVWDFGNRFGSTGVFFLATNHGRRSSQIGIGMHETGGVLRFDTGSGIVPVVGTWYHVAVTFEKGGEGLRLYVNGSLAGSEPYDGQSFDDFGNETWFLGKSNYNDPLMEGLIDEVRIYDRVLDAAEIEELTGFCPQAATAAPATIGMVTDVGSNTVTVFDADTDEVLGSLPLDGIPLDCSVLSDRSMGVVTNFQSEVWFVDLATQPPAFAAGTNPVPISNNGEDTSLTPDGKYVVVCDGSGEQAVSVVDIESREQVSELLLPTGCSSVEVCGDRSVLATAFVAGRLHRLTIDEFGQLTDTGQTLDFPEPFNTVCAPGSRTAVMVNNKPAEIHSVSLPDLTLIESRPLARDWGLSSSMHPGGNLLFVRSNDFTVPEEIGSVEVFRYDPVTGEIGATPEYSIEVDSAQGASSVWT